MGFPSTGLRPDLLPSAEAPGRLPWAVLLLEGRSFLFGLLGLFLVAGDWWIWPATAFGVLFVARGIRLRLTRWWVSDESFVIQQGLLFRSRRVISRARIQAVDLERGLFHRLLGLTEVRVEALGGSSTEGSLPGVVPEIAQALRWELLPGTRPSPHPEAQPAIGVQAPDGSVGPWTDEAMPRPGETPSEDAVLQERMAPSAAAEPGDRTVLVRLSGGDVVVAGLTESRLGAGVAAVGVGLEAIRQGAFSGWFGEFERWVPVLERLPWLAIFTGFVVLVLLFSLFLSFALTVIGYWGFTVSRRADVLEVERGLLTQHRDTVPLRRIQAVRVEENPFRRLMGLAAVRVVVGGRAQSNARSGTNVLLPVASREDAFALAALVSGGAEAETGWREGSGTSPARGTLWPPLNAMPPQARARRRFRALVAASVCTLLLPSLQGPPGGPLLLLPWNWPPATWGLAVGVGLAVGIGALLLAEGAWRGLGWGWFGADRLVVREGILTRTTTMVPLIRLQSVEVTSNPFQRRRGLATLEVAVARPPLESDPRALDLDGATASTLRFQILARSESVRRGTP